MLSPKQLIPAKSSFNFSGKQLLMLAVAALGYFVDVYDLLIFSSERIESLQAIGVAKENMKDVGIMILNFQMAGLIIGGFLFGILADKLGRLKVLFASILLYSLANIGNAFVTNVPAFAVARLFAGIGLAGELGVALSWISESLDRKQRTIATMIVSAIGLLGGVAAALVATRFHWQTSYIIGGMMGLVLLVLRISVRESKIFIKNSSKKAIRGDLVELFTNNKQLYKYMLCVFAGAPAVVFTNLYITLTPEFCQAFGIKEQASVSTAIMAFLLSFAVSDILCGFLSKMMQQRKGPLLIYAAIQLLAMTYFLLIPPDTLQGYYYRCIFLGFSAGYWGVLITNSVEQFGTNIRATVATSTPNLIRGITIPATLIFSMLAKSYGVITSGAIIGFSLIGISIISILLLKDKFENNLNYTEVFED
ncbi:MAG: MFS transporter [Saprospiraceae bacterium]|nr:MFS transporter [Saprospiraceae bacterium]